MNDKPDVQNELEDSLLDPLLIEIHQQSPPPDLSEAILSQLSQLGEAHQKTGVSESDSVLVVPSRPSRVKKARSSSGTRWLAMVASIAAAALIAFWISQGNQAERVAENDVESPLPASGIVQPDPISRDHLPETISPRTKDQDVPKGTPMIVKDDERSPKRDKPVKLVPSTPRKVAGAPIQEVADQLAAKWTGYWKAVGVQPSEQASPDEVAVRFSRLLGSATSITPGMKAAEINRQFAHDDVSKSIAKRWLNQISDGGTRRLSAQDHNDLTNEVALALKSGPGFNDQFVGLLSGQSENASHFFNAMASSGHDSMVRRLAAISMNVDLRCTKCHDSLIKGDGKQGSYWSFSKFIKQGLKRGNGNTWQVVSSDQVRSKPSFFELPDGRQRLIEPLVDSSWMPSALGATGDDVRQWAENVGGSMEFARGLVNSVWTLVHGRPLRGQVIDTIAAPHHELLDEIEDQLASDLIESDFDANRLFSLVFVSPVSFRSVPTAIKKENALTASTSEIQSAMELVNTFAAAMPIQNQLSTVKRIDIAMKSVGSSLRNLDSPDTLANIGEFANPKARKSTNSIKPPEITSFPDRASGPPVQWLARIDSYESQVNHLGYLAGMSEVPRPVMDAATAIHEGSANKSLALSRVWWLLGQ